MLARFPVNQTGRDFIVGDIHGMFRAMEALMELVSFDEQRDRMFSVGDLVDRGPDSAEALRWLTRPWFHAVRGNHEQFAIDSEDEEALDFWVKYNGGGWWLDLSAEDQSRFREAFLAMPLVMEVETDSGVVGIVHADVPPMVTWEDFVKLLETGQREVTLYALFSRDRIHGAQSRKPIRGNVDRIYCGHTPVRGPVSMDNIYYIDTGACYIYEGYEEARLTMVEIQPAKHQEYSVYTGPGGS